MIHKEQQLVLTFIIPGHNQLPRLKLQEHTDAFEKFFAYFQNCTGDGLLSLSIFGLAVLEHVCAYCTKGNKCACTHLY